MSRTWRSPSRISVLPEMYVPCPDCEGKRFNKATLGVKYNGKTISEVLETSFDERKSSLQTMRHFRATLKVFSRLGWDIFH